MTTPDTTAEATPLVSSQPGTTKVIKCGDNTDAASVGGGLAGMAMTAAAKGSVGAILGGGIAGCIIGAACSLFATNCRDNSAAHANDARPRA
jgi:hypothetical protein